MIEWIPIPPFWLRQEPGERGSCACVACVRQGKQAQELKKEPKREVKGELKRDFKGELKKELNRELKRELKREHKFPFLGYTMASPIILFLK